MASELVPATDRGLAYGDGVFRTLAVRAGAVHHWDRHYSKLAGDCARLAIPCMDREPLYRDVLETAQAYVESAVKIILTRGPGERGYRPAARPTPTCIVISSPLPVHPESYAAEGVALYRCRTRLGSQPALAGVKHLNRLENVLARAEWGDDPYAEGLLQDEHGNAVSGTMSNLFVAEGGTLYTPPLSCCGVAGITRDRVMDAARRRGVGCAVEPLPFARVMEADEVFVVNSLIGAWRVLSIGDAAVRTGGMVDRIRNWLDASGTAP